MSAPPPHFLVVFQLRIPQHLLVTFAITFKRLQSVFNQLIMFPVPIASCMKGQRNPLVLMNRLIIKRYKWFKTLKMFTLTNTKEKIDAMGYYFSPVKLAEVGIQVCTARLMGFLGQIYYRIDKPVTWYKLLQKHFGKI